MEFHLPLSEPIADLSAVRNSVIALDPAAVVDTAADGHTLRVACALGPLDLAWSLRRGGLAVQAEQLVTIPSVCCGGCSG